MSLMNAISRIHLSIENRSITNLEPEEIKLCGDFRCYPDVPNNRTLGAVKYSSSDPEYSIIFLFCNNGSQISNRVKVAFVPSTTHLTNHLVLQMYQNTSYGPAATHSYWTDGVWVMLVVRADSHIDQDTMIAEYLLTTSPLDWKDASHADRVAAVVDSNESIY
ncbi:hypothetical protein ABKN59_001498 [Abortiporus biennis]